MKKEGGKKKIRELWKETFQNFEQGGLSVASREDTEEVIDIFMVDKINPQTFLLNLKALSNSCSVEEILKGKEGEGTSKSISHFTSVVDRPVGTPLWFLAAYPDVIQWLNEDKFKELRKLDAEKREKAQMELFGIEKGMGTNQIENSEGELRPQYYQNLVENYKKETGNNPEVAVQPGSEDDIYMGLELLESIGTETNFTFVAENTTKYYLDLQKRYEDRFPDEASLLATAGILDAQYYIFIDETVEPREIINIAEEAVSSEGDSLVNFMIEFEAKLFNIDAPELNFNEVKEACLGEKEAIAESISMVRQNFRVDSRFSSNVDAFMESEQFKEIRRLLDIKETRKSFFLSNLSLLIGFIISLTIGYFLGTVGILLIVGPAAAGVYSAFWYLQREEISSSLIKKIAWANVVTWLIPIVGLPVSLATLVFSEQLKKKKYLFLGLLGLALSIIGFLIGLSG